MADQHSDARRLEPVVSELYSEYRNCDRWAIIVGISRYKYQNLNLKYADRDAEELYNLLLTHSGGNFKQEFIRKLTNEEATTGNITGVLRAFLQKPAREDLVIIYFACHGAPDVNRPSNVYLLTHDTNPNDIAGTALPMREIRLSLKENLHAQKVIILADTCHSAAIGVGIGLRRAVDDSALVNRYLQEVSKAKGGIALLTSAEANEVSFEDTRWGGGHGVFTYYLLEGMRGAADSDGNGIVTVGELFEYVRDNVKQATDHRQHPSIGTDAYDRNMPVALTDKADNIKKSPSVLNSSERDQKPLQSSQDDTSVTRSEEDRNACQDDLSSARGVDYRELRELLVAKKWRRADEETQEKLQFLFDRVGSIERLPCVDLWTIDKLWKKYSERQFCFSTQRRVWESINQSERDFWRIFCRQVGWISEGKLSSRDNKQQELTVFQVRTNLDTASSTVIRDGYFPSFAKLLADTDQTHKKIVKFFARLQSCRL
jgi:uncharacterized caspase-like protein